VTDHRSPPPQPEECLCRRYPSSQRGGTLIVEEVVTLDGHEQMLRSGGYRPRQGCPRCVGGLHVHDYRTRVLVADPAGVVTVIRFLCSSCRATWQMLPAFVAPSSLAELADRGGDGGRRRHRHRRSPASPTEAPVPASTQRRWLRRLAASAALLVVTVGHGGDAPADDRRRGGRTGPARGMLWCTSTRTWPMYLWASGAPQMAALLHRLAPGVRLM
jgi:hypothetical protein